MTRSELRPDDRLLTPYEVAALFGVGIKTIRKWANDGKLPTYTRTLGGHRRYLESDVRALLDGAK